MMKPAASLTLSGDQHEHLKSFLFPGDGKEAAAILLCGRRDGPRKHRLLVREIHGIPYEVCKQRTPERITWPPDYIAPILELATAENLSVIKIHSHPGGYDKFSDIDDAGDRRLLPMIQGWVERPILHGSAIMLPDGTIFGRILRAGEDKFEDLAHVNVAGEDIDFWYSRVSLSESTPDFLASHEQIFDEGTIERLGRLSIAVVGASGTGSPVVEQLTRLGVGEIVLVDDDQIEQRNVNRIINSTIQDAENEEYKVDVLARAIQDVGLDTRVVVCRENLWNSTAIREVAGCDVVFGCMDSIDGRYLLNMLATYYLLPYIDIGVRLLPDERAGQRGIREICGTVNYLQPGRSSLMSRELFTIEQVAQAGLERNDPDAHMQQVADGYIAGLENQRPAVISVNMFAASLAVNELLARLHPYREERNSEHASVQFSLSSMEFISDKEAGICERFNSKVGFGDIEPLLGQIELTERNAA